MASVAPGSQNLLLRCELKITEIEKLIAELKYYDTHDDLSHLDWCVVLDLMPKLLKVAEAANSAIFHASNCYMRGPIGRCNCYAREFYEALKELEA